MPIEITSELLKYNFTDKEKLDIGARLGRQTERVQELTEQKKRCVKDFDAQIVSAETEAAALGRQIVSGYEMRMIRVLPLRNRPVNGEQMRVRLDTGRIMDVRPAPAQMEIISEDFTHVAQIEYEDGLCSSRTGEVLLYERVPLFRAEAAELEAAGVRVIAIDENRALGAAAE